MPEDAHTATDPRFGEEPPSDRVDESSLDAQPPKLVLGMTERVKRRLGLICVIR